MCGVKVMCQHISCDRVVRRVSLVDDEGMLVVGAGPAYISCYRPDELVECYANTRTRRYQVDRKCPVRTAIGSGSSTKPPA
jgi:hypothetical protein